MEENGDVPRTTLNFLPARTHHHPSPISRTHAWHGTGTFPACTAALAAPTPTLLHVAPISLYRLSIYKRAMPVPSIVSPPHLAHFPKTGMAASPNALLTLLVVYALSHDGGLCHALIPVSVCSSPLWALDGSLWTGRYLVSPGVLVHFHYSLLFSHGMYVLLQTSHTFTAFGRRTDRGRLWWWLILQYHCCGRALFRIRLLLLRDNGVLVSPTKRTLCAPPTMPFYPSSPGVVGRDA